MKWTHVRSPQFFFALPSENSSAQGMVQAWVAQKLVNVTFYKFLLCLIFALGPQFHKNRDILEVIHYAAAYNCPIFLPAEYILIWQIFISPTLQWANLFFIVYSIYSFHLWESIMKSPPNLAKIPGRELSYLPTWLICRQMTKRTMREPLPVLVVVPTTEPPTVSPSLLRRGSQHTFDGSPWPQQLNKPPPPKLPAVPLCGRWRSNGRWRCRLSSLLQDSQQCCLSEQSIENKWL